MKGLVLDDSGTVTSETAGDDGLVGVLGFSGMENPSESTLRLICESLDASWGDVASMEEKVDGLLFLFLLSLRLVVRGTEGK